MLFLKLVAPMLVLLGALVNYFLGDHEKSDKNWKGRYARIFLTVLIVLGSIAAGVVIVNDHESSIIAQDKIENLNTRLDEAASDRDTLLNNLHSLQSSLTPFLRAAELRYPSLDSMDALNTLANELGNLQMKVDTFQQDYLADKEDQRAMEQLKYTPPQIEAKWAIAQDGRHWVEIISLNLVPFEARWILVNQTGRVLGVVMMGSAKFFPTEDRNRWMDVEMIDSTELVEDYVKFEFSYWSIYYAEMGAPDSLKGKIIHEYRLVENVPLPWK